MDALTLFCGNTRIRSLYLSGFVQPQGKEILFHSPLYVVKVFLFLCSADIVSANMSLRPVALNTLLQPHIRLLLQLLPIGPVGLIGQHHLQK